MKETQKEKVRRELFRMKMTIIRLQNDLKNQDDYGFHDGKFKCIDESFDELSKILG